MLLTVTCIYGYSIEKCDETSVTTSSENSKTENEINSKGLDKRVITKAK